MAVDLRAGGLRGRRSYEEDPDPMASVANVVDCMLVFACGLLMSLILAWNVDINSYTEIQQTDQMTEVENPEELDENLTDTNGSAYIDMGTVYMDPTTGKYYMVTPTDSTDTTTTDTTGSTATTGTTGESSSTSSTSTTSTGE